MKIGKTEVGSVMEEKEEGVVVLDMVGQRRKMLNCGRKMKLWYHEI